MKDPTDRKDLCRVLLVEDHPMFRERLAMLINKELNMSVRHETDNIRDAIGFIERSEVDIAIVDITLKGASGLELIKNIRSLGINLPVLVLSMHEEHLYAERALRAGARGYIMKSEASSEVVSAVRTVWSGEVYLSEAMKSRMLDRLTQSPQKLVSHGVEALTDRELEVFQQIGNGRNTREISVMLGLSESTVETYRARIKDKLGLRNAAELAQRAVHWVSSGGV